MAKIFVAESEQSFSYIQNLLNSKHELVSVKTLRDAAAKLKKQSFDLIIIDLYFDESRMFEAMQLAKTIPKNADKPIICMATSQIRAPFIDSVDFTARALGAWMFIDVYEHGQTGDAKSELLRVIERCLAGDARKATRAARVE